MVTKRINKMNTSIIRKITVTILGLFLCIFLLEVGIRIGGFLSLSLQEYRNKLSLSRKGIYRVLCLGDSMTACGYPLLLEEILNNKFIGIKFSVTDQGKGATNSEYVVSTLNENLNKYNPDMVIVMMGFNDKRNVLAYGNIPISKDTLFKTYKLTRILYYHIVNKVTELDIFKAKQGRENIKDNIRTLKQLDNFEEPTKNEIKHIQLIEPNRDNEKVYSDLVQQYRDNGEQVDDEEMFKEAKKAIEIDSKDYWSYINLGYCYRAERKYREAEAMFKKIIEREPEGVEAYIGLALCHRDKGEHAETEAIFRKAIEIAPNNYWSYISFAQYYMNRENYNKAEEMFKKAIKINPENYAAYFGLGWYYRHTKQYDKAGRMFKKAVQVKQTDIMAYLELGRWHIDQRNYAEAEAMFKKAIEMAPNDDATYINLAYCYNVWGKYELEEKYIRKADSLRLAEDYIPAITRYNYQKVKDMVTQKGIRLICVQYPMLNIEPLKRMFADIGGVIFVDNEKVFKDALKHGRFDEYFIDMFGDVFGHCTSKGNRLLAENIANVILKEYFEKYTK